MSSSTESARALLDKLKEKEKKGKARKAVEAIRDPEPLPELPVSIATGSDTNWHYLYTCRSCHVPKRCEMKYAPFCSAACQKRGIVA